jgi:hypothetical protein
MVGLLLVVYWIVCCCAGAYVALEKGRSATEGCWFGLLFGPIGVLIVACLPTKPTARAKGGE